MLFSFECVENETNVKNDSNMDVLRGNLTLMRAGVDGSGTERLPT